MFFMLVRGVVQLNCSQVVGSRLEQLCVRRNRRHSHSEIFTIVAVRCLGHQRKDGMDGLTVMLLGDRDQN